MDEFKKKLYMEKESEEYPFYHSAIASSRSESKLTFQDFERSKKKLERDLAESKRKVYGLLRGTANLS